jgi:putative ABC transport system permease protein
VLIGFEVARALFPNEEDPIGKTVKIKDLKYIVIGVIKKEGQSFMGWASNDYNACHSISIVQKIVSNWNRPTFLKLIRTSE